MDSIFGNMILVIFINYFILAHLGIRLIMGIEYIKVSDFCISLVTFSNIFISETLGPIRLKFNMKNAFGK